MPGTHTPNTLQWVLPYQRGVCSLPAQAGFEWTHGGIDAQNEQRDDTHRALRVLFYCKAAVSQQLNAWRVSAAEHATHAATTKRHTCSIHCNCCVWKKEHSNMLQYNRTQPQAGLMSHITLHCHGAPEGGTHPLNQVYCLCLMHETCITSKGGLQQAKSVRQGGMPAHSCPTKE